jgi:hypothetical protein
MKLSTTSGSRVLAAAARRGLAGLAACCVLAGAARAQVIEWTPRVGGDWENDSNIYYAPDAAQAVPGSRPRVSGHLFTWMAGLDLKHQGEFGSTYLGAEARRYDYSAGVGQLNRTEYNGSIGQRFGSENGNHFTVEGGGSRKLAPFLSLDNTTTFAYETQRYGRLSGTLALSGAQSLDLLAERRISKTPLVNSADYGTSENDYRVGYNRSATRYLSYGARVELNDGQYNGVNGAGDYRQLVPELYARYAVPTVIALDVSAGSTRRSQAGNAQLNTTTGSFDLHYELGVKTTLELGVTRKVLPYYATAGSELDTTYTVGLSWRPTARLSLLANGYRTRSDVTVAGNAGTREDHFDSGTVTATFQANRWLALGVYGRKQTRTSTIAAYGFDASTVGAQFRVQKP